jgi:hypothetical protein
MPRRKEETISKTKSPKSKVTTRKVAVRKKQEPHINEAEIARIKELLEREDSVLEEDLKRDFREILSERDRVLGKHNESDRRNKLLIIWIGVSLFMLSIISFWIASFDEIVKRPVMGEKPVIDAVSLDEAKDSLGTSLEQVMAEIDQLKKQANQLEADKAMSSTTASDLNNNFNLPAEGQNQ